jgi:hypothetical protein
MSKKIGLKHTKEVNTNDKFEDKVLIGFVHLFNGHVKTNTTTGKTALKLVKILSFRNIGLLLIK